VIGTWETFDPSHTIYSMYFWVVPGGPDQWLRCTSIDLDVRRSTKRVKAASSILLRVGSVSIAMYLRNSSDRCIHVTMHLERRLTYCRHAQQMNVWAVDGQ